MADEHSDIYAGDPLGVQKYFRDRPATPLSIISADGIRRIFQRNIEMFEPLDSEVAVSLFGSVARGTAGVDSDTDTFVYYDSREGHTPPEERIQNEFLVEKGLKAKGIHAHVVDIQELTLEINGMRDIIWSEYALSPQRRVAALFAPNFVLDSITHRQLDVWRSLVLRKIRGIPRGDDFLGAVVRIYLYTYGSAFCPMEQKPK